MRRILSECRSRGAREQPNECSGADATQSRTVLHVRAPLGLMMQHRAMGRLFHDDSPSGGGTRPVGRGRRVPLPSHRRQPVRTLQAMAPLVHVALAQLKPRKGDYRANLRRLGDVFAELHGLAPRPMVLALPESALTGYFLEGGVGDNAVTAGTLARDLDESYRGTVGGAASLDVVVGFYEIWNNKLYNSSLYVTIGQGGPLVRHVHRKVFLPTYGMFDEER